MNWEKSLVLVVLGLIVGNISYFVMLDFWRWWFHRRDTREEADTHLPPEPRPVIVGAWLPASVVGDWPVIRAHLERVVEREGYELSDDPQITARIVETRDEIKILLVEGRIK